MKKIHTLLAGLALVIAGCSEPTSPPPPTPTLPALDETESPCKTGGYIGSDGKWVCY